MKSIVSLDADPVNVINIYTNFQLSPIRANFSVQTVCHCCNLEVCRIMVWNSECHCHTKFDIGHIYVSQEYCNTKAFNTSNIQPTSWPLNVIYKDSKCFIPVKNCLKITNEKTGTKINPWSQYAAAYMVGGHWQQM